MENIVYSKLKNARISPRKFNLVAGLVRGKNAKSAIDLLRFTPKRGAKILSPVIMSALKNASNNYNFNEDNMVISDIKVGPGKTAKSGRFAAKGRFNKIRKRSTNVTVILKETTVAQAPINNSSSEIVKKETTNHESKSRSKSK
jgi:large subunit ribosomal protein L22